MKQSLRATSSCYTMPMRWANDFARRALALATAAVIGLAATAASANPPTSNGRPELTAQKAKRKPSTDRSPKKHPAGGAKAGAHGAPAVPPRPSSPLASHEPPKPKAINLLIEKSTLENGLRVVISPDSSFPAVGVSLAVAAGGRNETQAQTGFAALAVRAMCGLPAAVAAAAKAPRNLPPAMCEADRDSSVYTSVVSPNALDLALWAHATRLSHPGPLTARMHDQLEFVRSLSNTPDPNALNTQLEQMVYEGYFPYSHRADLRGIDLSSARPESVVSFIDSYYAPNNAVLVISGDFDPDRTMRMVHTFFDDLKRKSNVPVFNAPPLPDQTNQRSLNQALGASGRPSFTYGWAIPGTRQPEHDALQSAAGILGGRTADRIRSRLARSPKVGPETSVAVTIEPRRGPSLFTIAVDLPAQADVSEAMKLADEEVDSMARLGPSTEEVVRSWSDAERAFITGLQSHDARVGRLARLELLHGDARLVHADLQRILSVRKDDIRKAVARFLSPNRRSVVAIRSALAAPVTEDKAKARPHPAAVTGSSDPSDPNFEPGAPSGHAATPHGQMRGKPSPPIPGKAKPNGGTKAKKPTTHTKKK